MPEPRVGPFTLQPLLVEKPWGGESIERLLGYESTGRRIGEAWLCADLAETSLWGAGGQPMVSVVSEGWGRGRTLQELIATHAIEILGRAAERFPLLLKVLDADRNLSVQVHPSRQYATSHPSAHVKSEAWLSLEVRGNGRFFVGTHEQFTAERFADVVRGGDVVRTLHGVEVAPGDAVLIPSGTVHALGAGSVVFEVQTASDTTFRIYDWSRETGVPSRPLQVDEALAACDLDLMPRWHRASDTDGGDTIFSTADFDLQSFSAGRHELQALASGRAMALFPKSAGASVTTVSGDYELPPYRVTIVPVALMRLATVNVSQAGGVVAVTVR